MIVHRHQYLKYRKLGSSANEITARCCDWLVVLSKRLHPEITVPQQMLSNLNNPRTCLTHSKEYKNSAQYSCQQNRKHRWTKRNQIVKCSLATWWLFTTSMVKFVEWQNNTDDHIHFHSCNQKTCNRFEELMTRSSIRPATSFLEANR